MKLAGYSPQWRDDLMDMWRASFEFGVGIEDPHPLHEQAHYFDTVVLPNNDVRLAVADDRLLGFVAATRESISQLYVRTGWHRQGIGSVLLDWAKAQSSGSLWLYTFARNRVARQFYERHGFAVAARGFEPGWQLEDIRYQWAADGGRRQSEST